jgi:hypothetical protein
MRLFTQRRNGRTIRPALYQDPGTVNSRPPVLTGPRNGVPLAQSARSANGLAQDSGMVSHYVPAEHIKQGPIARLIGRISGLWNRTFKRAPAEKTTEQGAAAAASPSTYAMSLWQLRYERRAVVADVRQMVDDDPRAKKSTIMFAREAVRGGVNILIPEDASTERFRKIATDCAENVKKMVDGEDFSWAWMLPVEGDLFVQAVVAGSDLMDAKRMPAAAMERNTDDTDEFVTPEEAFSQVDVLSNSEVASWPLALMHHERWCHVDGERYGTSELMAGRRLRRLLELQEDAQAVRRMSRAAMKLLWNVGTAEKPAPNRQVIEEFKEDNGFVEGRQELFDPMNVATNVYGNGLISVTPISGDSGISSIEDITYAQNVYTVCLPTPAPLYNLGSAGVNRDTLTEIYAQFLKDTSTLSESIARVVRFLMDLSLLLKGVLPELIPYAVHYSESSIETNSEIVTRILTLRANILGAGTPNAIADPLISRLKAMQLLADIIGVEEAQKELEQIEKEWEEIQAEQQKLQQEQAAQQAKIQQEQAEHQQSLQLQGQQESLRMQVEAQQQAGGGAPGGGASTTATRNGRNGNGSKPAPLAPSSTDVG